ncbi:hypothetical protein MuYL_1615 [Mucilaginibacter xinganensis]|uniref:Uncharacterized protein n=2 Tax=Mucilaginibacter xinganensis TaxID=1234841 RepID=A0A223NUG3_9SPHI|nr:hypothetical protein MuYL_1615 [Mucilaginibacter xinganensis]
MKPVIAYKYIVAIGLLLLSASLVLKHYFVLPDFADGFLKGTGIGVLLLALVKKQRVKQSNN